MLQDKRCVQDQLQEEEKPQRSKGEFVIGRRDMDGGRDGNTAQWQMVIATRTETTKTEPGP